ncbi:transposable element Tcb2 transposase [Trichonephila clavipes]|nr:transposable element Tcb2 transposase [Trichonephila clavipes]
MIANSARTTSAKMELPTLRVIMKLTARRNRTENATQLQRQLLLATGRRVSSQTVRNRLHEGGLYARRPMSVTPDVFLYGGTGALEITPHSFVKGHNTEELVGWYGVESAYADVRTCISFVMDDNARPHRARLVENMLEAETIQHMEWPACSPDLNPIEPVWDMLRRRIAAQPRPPATVRVMEIALLEEWNSIPQSLIDNLIASMANRCAAVLAVRGDHTPY